MSLPRQDRYRDSPSSSKPQVSFSGEPPSSPSKNDGTLRMTVKMPSQKLATVGRTGGTRGVAQKVTKSTRGVAQPKIKVSARESFEGGEILESKRKREVKKSYVVESDSDEDNEVEEGDAMDVDEDDVDEDAEGDEDEDMSGQPPPRPIIKSSRDAETGKAKITAKPQPAKAPVRPVEAKEMDSDSDEELSELGSEMEDETMMMGEEDAEGDEEEIEVEEDDDSDLDSDLDTPGGGSRASTPDLSKLTRRQRARLEEGGSGHLLALPDEVQVKKHLTAEEHAMRRAEMARRRKNLSEKRNEEEKMETINKLLKKQAPKTNARRKELNGEGGSADNGESGKPNPIFTRWISNKEGNSVSVPNEWLEAPFGEIFKNGIKQENKQGALEGVVGQETKNQLLGELEGGKMVEEVQ